MATFAFEALFSSQKKNAKLPIQMSNVIITVFSFQPVDSNDVLMMPPQRGRQLIFSSRAEHIRIRSFMHDARFIN